ncbi:hypothetical protein GOP56_00730 [Brevibacillus sp. 7WMA2]|uniref:cytochrome d ubiquinol oxidase subunit II n=1 Tax=Brevibacillus TaxID=55080 RepID=UPI0002404F1E|nr:MULTISPECIES: cytochrome d ubiquinol oxidase subunit II [Brevibacillus]AYK07411.1 hypothetical protein D8Z77_14100 [Brevibacillus laterosporus]MCR8964805.1 cytochrome d ubiquinol oxidase subunit II [Brevibacillus laterosporus]MCR8994983.1 cytochrome d ubiquinol oxidase subunit II [Brevibacillus laterosporus]MCZ0836960.1 cytochrome d ubiquinol oxidase subunit II [Brevibacillus halotolerans]QIC04251.1 hypothetical protein GOP56_00730 [Brevibacillus sp. 7WMA2]
MSDTIIAVTMLWGFVFIYSVAASIDFGAGFWSMIYRDRDQTKATQIANRYLSPSWEVTNVFIVLIVIALVTFFPGATYTLGTVLIIPGSLILLLLLLRSAFLVFSHVVEDYRKMMSIISGITGILIPALLISVLPITQGGFITLENGYEQLQLLRLFSSPHEYMYIGLAITSTLFLSSLLLADFSNVLGEREAFQIYRRDARIVGPITIVLAIAVVITMSSEASWIYANLRSQTGWLVASAGFFLLSYASLYATSRRKGWLSFPRFATIAAIIQYLLASYAYGVAHLPYLVYPNVTIESGFTHPNNFRAMFVVYIVGFAILTPGFLYFWRLFMNDTREAKKS